MNPNHCCGRKDRTDVNKGVQETTCTSSEIDQDEFRDATAESTYTVNTVDEQIKNIAEKVENAAAEIKKGSIDIAQNIKQTAINVARTVTSSSDKDE